MAGHFHRIQKQHSIFGFPIIRKLSLFILYGVSLENCADRFMNMAVFFTPAPPHFKICLDSVDGGCKMYEVFDGIVCVRCMRMCVCDSRSVRNLMLMLWLVALLSHAIFINFPHVPRTQILKLCSEHRHLCVRIQPSREKRHP